MTARRRALSGSGRIAETAAYGPAWARLPRALLHLQIIAVVEPIGMSKRAATRAVIDPVTRFLAQLPNLRGKRILLALSGGADSVALLYALLAACRKFPFE